MDQRIEAILEAATEAAEGPGHEVAILSRLLRAAAEAAPDRLAGVLACERVRDTHAAALGEDAGDVAPPVSLDALIASARRHGEDSEPDHEAGDLQEYLRAYAEAMDDAARVRFEESGAVRDLAEHMPGGPTP